MMLKIRKTKSKLLGIIITNILLCVSYAGVSFYNVPEKASAIAWFPEEGPVSIPDNYTISDIKYLQEMNKTVCDNSAIGDSNTVLDIRDDNDYTIGKLADGKCWMTQNLRLAGDSVLTSADSNVASSYTLPNPTGDTFSSPDPANGQMKNSTDKDYGAYYSFNAATAGSASSKSSGTADYDICPKGWRLPTGNTNGEFQTLYDAAGDNKTTISGWIEANSNRPGTSNKAGSWLGASSTAAGGTFFPAAGSVNNSNSNTIGLVGYYWSSTIHGTTSAYRLSLSSHNAVQPANYDARFPSYSVRCIANEKVLESESLSDSRTLETGSIAVKVANTLSIDAVSGMEEEVDSTSIASGAITATIAANTNYKVLLSAEKTSLTSTSSTNTAEIPALSTVQAGTNAWGIRNSDNSTYSAIANQEKEYYNTATLSTNPNIPGTVHTFNIGISVSPSLPADTYSTEVTITAAAA